MTFITTPEPSASRKTAQMYETAEQTYGYLPNMYRTFGHRPEVMDHWSALLTSIRGNMELRRYELVTLAAARELKSSYCMLAHGTVLLREGLTPADLSAVVADAADAPLDDTERAIMGFAAKVVRDATSITQDDIDGLKAFGLTDAEIFDITAAAAVRCFYSKTLDALGTSPDAIYAERLGSELTRELAIGRAIEDGTA